MNLATIFGNCITLFKPKALIFVLKNQLSTKFINMKRLMLYIVMVCMPLLFATTSLKADNETSTVSVLTQKNVEITGTNANPSTSDINVTDLNAAATSDAAEATNANADLTRLREIKAMDFSNMSRSEKKELRLEVASIQRDQYQRHDNRYRNHGDRRGHSGSVIFIGGGGLLLIILILILLL
jgi:hypothetical protein